MTKLSVARVFEVSQVAATKAYGELQSFFEYFNQLTDNLLRVIQNGVGIRDNLDAELKTISLTHGSPTPVAFRKRPVAVVACAETGGSLAPLVALHSAPGQGATTTLTAYFGSFTGTAFDAPAQTVADQNVRIGTDKNGSPLQQSVTVIAFFS